MERCLVVRCIRDDRETGRHVRLADSGRRPSVAAQMAVISYGDWDSRLDRCSLPLGHLRSPRPEVSQLRELPE